MRCTPPLCAAPALCKQTPARSLLLRALVARWDCSQGSLAQCARRPKQTAVGPQLREKQWRFVQRWQRAGIGCRAMLVESKEQPRRSSLAATERWRRAPYTSASKLAVRSLTLALRQATRAPSASPLPPPHLSFPFSLRRHSSVGSSAAKVLVNGVRTCTILFPACTSPSHKTSPARLPLASAQPALCLTPLLYRLPRSCSSHHHLSIQVCIARSSLHLPLIDAVPNRPWSAEPDILNRPD